MADSKDTFKDHLARYRQIEISVIGRKSGQTISIPVWFVLLDPAGKSIHYAPCGECEIRRLFWPANPR
jgi:hypothetical protein